MASRLVGRYYFMKSFSSSLRLVPTLTFDKVFFPLFASKRGKFGFPKLTPQQVNNILRAHEKTVEVTNPTAVKSFDTNQLPSNNPIEDRHAEGRCILTTGMLFGVFDGHAGSACAEVVSQRLFDYLAASLLPSDLLKEYSERVENESALVTRYHNDFVFPKELKELYSKSFLNYLRQLKMLPSTDFVMTNAMMKAFTSLDDDMSTEAQADIGETRTNVVAVAGSGCVVCIAHVDGPHLHVASAGDCQAVLGVLNENKMWVPKLLTKEHNSENASEVSRILSQHPLTESDTIIKHDRLLGQLAPLRAFGDFRYKWKTSLLKKILVPLLGKEMVPPNYYTPPYLTAAPEVTYHHLMPRDKFLVIGSDGLWEQLTHLQVVRLVGEYMSGRQTLDVLKLPNKNMKLSQINELLSQRREGIKNKPVDTNAATHLIRNALGGTEYGIEHSMLSQMLSLSDDMVRLMRDDITIIVVFFDTDYLRRSPA